MIKTKKTLTMTDLFLSASNKKSEHLFFFSDLESTVTHFKAHHCKNRHMEKTHKQEEPIII